MISRRPTTAESGNPFAIALPKHARSGMTPKRSCAPPSARRNPVTTSSKISTAPFACVSVATRGRKSRAGSTTPTGSMITAAICPGCSAKMRSSEPRLSYANVCVSARTAAGTPRRRVVVPMYQSCQPW